MTIEKTLEKSLWRDLALLFIAIALFFAIGLGARPYLTPSEARYIELPRQMLLTHDWLTPRINGVPYFEKPPLFYWLQASVMQCLGMGEFAGRLSTLLLSTLICLVTYATGRMLFGRLAGLLASFVLATCILGYALSRVAMVDMPVSLFMTCSIAAFLAAQISKPSPFGRGLGEGLADSASGISLTPTLSQRERGMLYIAMYVAAALAVLSKGLIGMVIPGLVIGTWILATQNWRILREAKLIPGLIIFLIIAAPWHIWMAQKHPDFLNFYFIHEHFTRFLTDEHKRDQPWWFFTLITLVGLLPWTGLIFPALKKLRSQDPILVFILLWIVLPFVFFSTSHSKLAPYIFPIFPPLAILMGDVLAQIWRGEISAKSLNATAIFTTLLFSAAIAIFLFVPLPQDADRKLDFAGSITPTMLMPVVIALAALVIAIATRRARLLICALGLFGATLDITVNYAMPTLDRASVKPLVNIIKDEVQPQDMVVSFGTYFQDLPVYLNRNVTVVGYDGELEFGIDHYPETRSWMIGTREFWKRCAETHAHIFVFMKRMTLDDIKFPKTCPLRISAEYGKTVLLEKE